MLERSEKIVHHSLTTDMPKKSKDRLRDPALYVTIWDHATLSFDIFDISVNLLHQQCLNLKLVPWRTESNNTCYVHPTAAAEIVIVTFYFYRRAFYAAIAASREREREREQL